MRYFFLLSIFLGHLALQGQQITVSEKIQVGERDNIELLGQIGNNILMTNEDFRDVTTFGFDESLNKIFEQDLYFEQKKRRIIKTVAGVNNFTTFFVAKTDGIEQLIVNKYDQDGSYIDSLLLDSQEKDLANRKFRVIQSESKNMSAVIGVKDNKYMSLYLYHHKKDSLLSSEEYFFVELDFADDVLDLQLSETGILTVLVKKNGWTVDNTNFEIFLFQPGASKIYKFDIDNTETNLNAINWKLDDLNNIIQIFGIGHDHSHVYSDRFFWIKVELQSLQPLYKPEYQELDPKLIIETSGNAKARKKKKFGLEYFDVESIIPRIDGGIIVLLEKQKQVSNNNFNVSQDAYRGRLFPQEYNYGSYDYYNEDIIAMAFNRQGDLEWQKVLYKKQYSQNDNAAYSGYFKHITPEHIRLLYNDEIKNENTVSEYVINPYGDLTRNSLLNTTYQKLRLSFANSVAVSATKIIVPSIQTSGFQLVSIEY